MNGLKLLIVLSLLAFGCQLSAAHAESGITYLEKIFLEGKYAKAVEEAGRLIDARASQADEAYYIKGLSELKLNKFADARKSFESLVNLYPRSKRISDAYLSTGDSYFLEGNKATALVVYNQMLEKFPNDNNALLVQSRIKDCGSRPVISDTESAVRVMTKDVPKGESAGFISVQVGSFKNKRNAERVADKLSRQGFVSYVEIPQGSDRLYRVKAGKFQSSRDAEALAVKLKAKGYRTKICSDKK